MWIEKGMKEYIEKIINISILYELRYIINYTYKRLLTWVVWEDLIIFWIYVSVYWINGYDNIWWFIIIITITFISQNIFDKKSLECKKKCNSSGENFMWMN